MLEFGYNGFKFGGSILKSNIKNLNSNSGFTLVEIVLVVAFLGILLTGVLTIFVNVMTTNKSNEYYSLAYKQLDSKIEEIRNTPFTSLPTYPTSFTPTSLPGNPTGTVTLTNNIDGNVETNIYQVDVSITWNFKRQQTIKTSTYVTKGGLRR